MRELPPPAGRLRSGHRRFCGKRDRPIRARYDRARLSAGRPRGYECAPTVLDQAAATLRRWHDYRTRSEEHTSELQSLRHLVCRILLGKKENATELLAVRYLLSALLLGSS